MGGSTVTSDVRPENTLKVTYHGFNRRLLEFASPYSYLAAQQLPALAARHGRPLRWRPIELRKVWGAQGVLEAYAAVRRVKAGYIMRDATRLAADRDLSLVPFRSLPDATLARLVVHRLN